MSEVFIIDGARTPQSLTLPGRLKPLTSTSA